MREILFRGKVLGENKWVDGYYVKQFNTNTIYCKDDCEFEYRNVDPETVCQYTGLKDKNGQKIFEWDILKWDNEWPDYCEVARWDYELFDMRKNDWAQFCEVIGNRWDNPELLEGMKE